jgi:glyoxylase-like metal-dependent hydrolase (beta-lactamase superfamily II)
MPASRTFGAFTVVALTDGVGPFVEARDDMFPRATARMWQLADERDPVAADGGWRLQFRCYAIRLASGGVVLVDTGIGDANAPASSWAPVPGRLPEELSEVGIAPGDVETVVITHMHTDHIGWAVSGSAPFFPNARYLLQQTEIEAIETLRPGLIEWLLEPLRSTGQLSAVDGEARLHDGLRVVATPGHTPGHQSVLVETADGTVLFTGDLLVHMLQLVDPDQPYANELDPDRARESRVAMLRELAARGDGTLATAHLTEPFLPWP